MRRALSLALGAVAVIAALVPAAAAGAVAGELDPSFGAGGTERLFVNEPEVFIAGIAVQPDGKILLTGSKEEALFVARLLENGSFDPSFGVGGEVTTPIAGAYAGGVDLVVEANGKIVVGGGTESATGTDFLAARYEPNGAIDPTFGGGDGIAIVPVGTEADDATAIALGAGGRLLLTGESGNGSGGSVVGVAVLQADGTPDPTFAATGVKTIETSGSGKIDSGTAILEGPGGAILIADSSGPVGGNGFTLVRLTATGELDPTFDGDGVVTIPIPGSKFGGRVEDVALQPDGRIVAVGYGFDETGTGSDAKIAALRLLPSGALDPNFGGAGSGIFTDQLGVGRDRAEAVSLAPSGKILLGGSYEPAKESESLALLRLTADGTLDPSFGSGGASLRGVTSPLGESFEGGALDSRERYVALSEIEEENNQESYGVTRYLADPPPSPPALGPPAPTVPPRASPPPHAKLKALPKTIDSAKLKGFSGTADGTAAKVQIALELLRAATPKKAAASKAGGKKTCLQLKSPRAKFKTVKAKKGTACPLRWLNATGTTAWSYKLKKSLPTGRYVVYARALDAAGATEKTFSKAAGDRIAFRVVSK